MRRTKTDILSNVEKDVVTSKIVANNTLRLEYADSSVAIRLHDTDIVTTLPNGNIRLSSGGWRTKTTKERMTDFSPFRVFQDKGVWYVNGETFYDDITFTPDGVLVGASQAIEWTAIKAHKSAIAKFVAQLSEDNLPLPEAGDCLLCRFPGDSHCAALHLRENYLHGSLLVKAMRSKGYNDNQIGLHYSLKIVDTFKRALRVYMHKAIMPDMQTR